MCDVAFEDPRLAALYDQICAGREDTDFYVDLAGRLGATSVLDVGCGTGVIASSLATQGHQVVGVDPASAMLSVARHQPNADLVRWGLGEASSLGSLMGSCQSELAIMTGHVAQIFLSDASWASALTAVHTVLRPGGRIAFEFRNPAARAWIHWHASSSRRTYLHPTDGPVDTWVDTLVVSGSLVSFQWTYVFTRTGRTLRSTSTLRFPTLSSVEASLRSAGFAAESLYGDWDRSPFTPTSPEMIFVAKKSS